MIRYNRKGENKVFVWWFIMVALCFVMQSLGNTAVPEVRNFGIIGAVMFTIVIYHDLKVNEQ